ncbi:MAG: IPT/TIG domain-containing protein [Lewinellaceae bacterium]|nr:IPT/TIG domain-containing protein [Lewinellaceae bacterium]
MKRKRGYTPAFGEHSFFRKANATAKASLYVSGEKWSVERFESAIADVNRFPRLTYEENLQLLNGEGRQRRDTCDIIPSARKDNTMEFTFENVRYTNNFKNLDFDVMVKVNTPGLKFGRAQLYIDYSQEFGTSVIANNTVTVTRGIIIQDTTMYTLNVKDYASQIMSINIDSPNPGNTLFTLSENPESIIHVSLDITDFTQIGNISFDDIDVTGQVQYWCNGSYEPFDNVIFDEPIYSVNGNPNSEIGIEYTFENISYNSNMNRLSVDIFAKSTSSSYYSNGEIYIDYNENGFGTFVWASNNAEFTLQGGILDQSVYLPTFTDYDNNTLSLLLFGLDESNLSTLDQTPQKIGKITFTVDPSKCSQLLGLAFNIETIFGINTHYTGTMPIPNEYYSPVVIDDEENSSICGCMDKPEITSFSPTTIHAGTGEILTITGSKFGNWDETKCTVIFPNGDADGGDTEAGIKDFEWDGIIHWSDTEIKIKVPSTDKNSGTSRPASTGKIKIKNQCGTSNQSSTVLQIPYSIFNYRPTTYSFPRKLTLEAQKKNGICMQYAPDVPIWVRDAFEDALTDWCGTTGINFYLGGESNNSELDDDDGVNLITFSNTGTGGEMETSSFYFLSNYCDIDKGFAFKEIDFEIRSSLTNPTQQDEVQMREIIKHELGHAHMLTHARSGSTSFQYLMHPNGNSGGFITADDATGANLVFVNSNYIISECGIPIGSGECGMSCGSSSVSDNHITKFNAMVYPNPTQSGVFIYLQQDYDDLSISVLNSLGDELNRYTSLTNYIPLPERGGLYILKITIDGQSKGYKIVKP